MVKDEIGKFVCSVDNELAQRDCASTFQYIPFDQTFAAENRTKVRQAVTEGLLSPCPKEVWIGKTNSRPKGTEIFYRLKSTIYCLKNFSIWSKNSPFPKSHHFPTTLNQGRSNGFSFVSKQSRLPIPYARQLESKNCSDQSPSSSE